MLVLQGKARRGKAVSAESSGEEAHRRRRRTHHQYVAANAKHSNKGLQYREMDSVNELPLVARLPRAVRIRGAKSMPRRLLADHACFPLSAPVVSTRRGPRCVVFAVRTFACGFRPRGPPRTLSIARCTLGGTVNPNDFATATKSSSCTSNMCFSECEAYEC